MCCAGTTVLFTSLPAHHAFRHCHPPAALPADNVIRAGLTPKMRDTEVLCESLTYGQGMPRVLTGEKAGASPHLAVYRPPFRCAGGGPWAWMRAVASPSLGCTAGLAF